MTAPITQFNVPFSTLNFTRNGNNLTVSDATESLATYENFFNGEEMGTVETIETNDGDQSGYTEHNILNEAIIEVNDIANYQGYNVSLEGGLYTGYSEEVTVEYDGNTYSPTGSDDTYDSVIYGNYGNDVVYGNNQDDWIQGNEGNDIIYGGSGGADILYGNAGDDIVVAGELSETGNYTVELSETETVKVNLSQDNATLYGLDGTDTLHGGNGNDNISGGTLGDTIFANGGDDTIYGGDVQDGTSDSIASGADLIYGDDGNDLIHGGDGNDSLYGGNGNDTLYGDSGNNSMYGNTGNDILVAGSGNDTFVFASQDGNDTVQNATSTDTVVFSDTKFSDLTFLKATNNLVISNGENDSVTIENYFTTASPVDTVFANNSTNVQSQYSILNNATINVNNVANYQGINIEISEGVYSGYNENITVAYDGTKYSPTGSTNTYDSVIYGNYGNDVVYGNNQDDWIQGNEGNDIIYGGSGGADILYGNAGDDIVVAGAMNSSNRISYNTSSVTMSGEAGNDTLSGGIGNDTIQGGIGNDILKGNGGGNTFIFAEDNFGEDIIQDTNANDILQFTTNTGTESSPVYSGINFSDLTFAKNGNNLIITAPDYVSGEDTITNNVTVKNYFKTSSARRVDTVLALNDDGIQEEYSISNEANIAITLNSNENTYKGSDGNETIIASNYISPNGVKGVTITTGKGNNTITGSIYNDNIRTGAGNNNITENNGTNKITTGKGNDSITFNNYSTNTANLGAGNNIININSYNNNKVTTGIGNDTLTVTNGFNTANLGAGNNIININNASTNKITTGKGDDTFTIVSGVNTINSGSGNEIFTISGGYNAINSGAGISTYTISGGELNKITAGRDIDTFNISDGLNNISAKGADDIFNVTGGENQLFGEAGNDTFNVTAGSNILVGGAGDDTYNFVDYDNLLTASDIQISDNGGANNIILNNTQYNTTNISLYVDVEATRNGKGKINGDWAIVSRTNTDADYVGVEFSGGNKSSMDITLGTMSYTVDKNALNEIASSVSAWLTANNYESTDAVFEAGINEDVTGLIGVYNTASAEFFNVA